MSSWIYTCVAVSPRITLGPYPASYVDFVARVTRIRTEHPADVVALGSWFDGWCETFRELGMELPATARVLDWKRGEVDYKIYGFTHKDAKEMAKRAVAARRGRKPGLNSYAVNAMIPTLRAAAMFAGICNGDVLIAIKNVGASLGDGELGNGNLPNELYRHSGFRDGRG